jgi:hypothetical protein
MNRKKTTEPRPPKKSLDLRNLIVFKKKIKAEIKKNSILSDSCIDDIKKRQK